MEEVRFRVEIDDSLPATFDEPVIAIGDGWVGSPNLLVYRSDPTEPGSSALQRFWRDLILGRPLPTRIVARRIQDIDEALILALFLDRRLAVLPATPGLVMACDLGRLGPAGLAHVDRDVVRFIGLARRYLEAQPGEIKQVVEWLRDHLLEGVWPALPPEPLPPRVLDVGTGGFVVAEASEGCLVDGWTELYRAGYLRGCLFRSRPDGRQLVLAARKGPDVSLDLDQAARRLNEGEVVAGGSPLWIGESLWLWGPEEGTQLPASHILAILTRA